MDVQGCDKDKLTDMRFIHEFLKGLVEHVGMTMMTLPYVCSWKDKFAETPGISGFVMIAESHVSIHTFPDYDYFFIDLFSCRDFDVERAENFIRKSFAAQKVEKHLVKRGAGFSRMMVAEARIKA
jgi:S-adenosylmethionine decarboxylase